MANNKFKMLRAFLFTLGLSKESAHEVVDWISNLLASEKDNSSSIHNTKNETPNVVLPRPNNLKLPYAKRADFLSAAELNFYRVLVHTLNNSVAIFTKVGLNDIFYVKSPDRSEYQTFFNKIARKHVDFLICDLDSLVPICGIELDDKSHNRRDRQDRDRFVDAVFEISNLPLIHVPVSESYTTSKLSNLLNPYLPNKVQHDKITLSIPDILEQSSPVLPATIPLCYKCGSEMILRTTKRGDNVGKNFWGCSNYPHCRAILKIEE